MDCYSAELNLLSDIFDNPAYKKQNQFHSLLMQYFQVLGLF